MTSNEIKFEKYPFIWQKVISQNIILTPFIGLFVYVIYLISIKPNFIIFWIILTLIIIVFYYHLKIELNYLKFSINKTLIITNELVKIVDKKSNNSKELLLKSIIKIEKFECQSGVKFPWLFKSYFIISNNENELIVPCYILELFTFRLSKYSKKIKHDEYIFNKLFYPIIKIKNSPNPTFSLQY